MLGIVAGVRNRDSRQRIELLHSPYDRDRIPVTDAPPDEQLEVGGMSRAGQAIEVPFMEWSCAGGGLGQGLAGAVIEGTP